MKYQKAFMTLLIITALLFPVGSFAMKEMDHGEMKQKNSDHSGMDMGGQMIMLKDHEVEGVMASAHMMDVREKMAEHGMSMTHHLMVGFMDTEGNSLEKGSVALKVESPDKSVAKPVKMMGMNGSFGTDIALEQKGTYHFIVGTKLADGTKRTFMFQFEN